MQANEVQTIMECLPKGKTPFYYFRDRFAPMLLSYGVRDGATVGEVKKSRYGRLLSNPLVRGMIERAGDGRLTSELLQSVWPREYECYLLTLGVWGRGSRWFDPWYQTSRPGFNLVLQLNFSGKHDRPYQEMVRPVERHPFENEDHPIAQKGRHTLAWSRLDIDLDAGEALIEEIQNDWIRRALQVRRYAQWYLTKTPRRKWEDTYYGWGINGGPTDILAYADRVLSTHVPLWDEAMLSATIWFLREELGIRTVYYHSFETGSVLKHLRWSQPPRSLYTDLPRRFCFEKTPEGPSWMKRVRRTRTWSLRKAGELQFWRMAF